MLKNYPVSLKNKVVEEARRQLSAADSVEYGVEWLVSDTSAIEQLTNLFKKEGININVKYLPE